MKAKAYYVDLSTGKAEKNPSRPSVPQGVKVHWIDRSQSPSVIYGEAADSAVDGDVVKEISDREYRDAEASYAKRRAKALKGAAEEAGASQDLLDELDACESVSELRSLRKQVRELEEEDES